MLLEQILEGKANSRRYVMRVAIEKELKANRTAVFGRGVVHHFCLDHSYDSILAEVLDEYRAQGLKIEVLTHSLAETYISVSCPLVLHDEARQMTSQLA